ncbi:MAG TPA: molybdate ABC transporter permease subunit [Candidatus Binataceae bacterium]
MIDHEDFSILLFTLRIAALSTAVILPFGIFSAWALARSGGGARGLVETALSLPLVLPPTAVGLLLLELLSRYGFVGRLLQALGTEIVFTWKAVVLATAVMSFPLLVRPVRAAFEEVDPQLINVARTLGATPMAAFARVTIPLSWRGILTGTILAFSRSLGEFGATIMIAGNIPGKTQTMALAIFSRAELGDDRAAMRLVALTAVIAFAAIWTTEIFAQRRTRRIAH